MSYIRKNDPVLENLSQADRKKYLSMIKQGASRREFMGYLMAVGATAAASGTLFTDLSKAWAETPKYGGRIILATDQHGPADTLDPALFTGSVDYFRGRMFYGSLTRLTDNLGYEPELAEEIIPNSDATMWTFKLKKGVEFHDGKTLNADDVIYSMNRHRGDDSISTAKSLMADIERWEKVNEHEVRAILKTPNADLPIALGTFQFKIVQNGQTDFSAPVGTGPFRVKEFKPGVRTIGTRFENYWEEGRPYLDEIEHYGIADPNARLNAFLAGDIDGMVNVPPKAIEQVQAAPGKDIWSLKSGRYINISPRHDIATSGNPHLWRAMQYLQDRQRLAKGVWKNEATLGNDHPIAPAYFDHSPDIPQRELDLDKAKYHFQQSGIGSTPIPIVASEVAPGAIDQCLFVQREGKKIGLNFDVRQVTTDGYWSAVWLIEPIFVATWNMRPTANIMMTLAFKSDAPWNETKWKNEQFDQTLTAVRGVTDAAKRKQMYHDLQMMIHEDNGMSIPIYGNYTDAVASYVQGRTYVPLNNFGGAEGPAFMWRTDA